MNTNRPIYDELVNIHPDSWDIPYDTIDGYNWESYQE